MSLHNKPEYNTPEIVAALKQHGLDVGTPSQLSDTFRLGWLASLEAALAAQPEQQQGLVAASPAAAGQQQSHSVHPAVNDAGQDFRDGSAQSTSAPSAEVLQESARYRWLRERFLGADFDWNESGKQALVFRWGGGPVWGDLDITIEPAMAKEPE